MRLAVLLTIGVAWGAVGAHLEAQELDPMPLTRLDQPIVLDGMSDEAEWEAVPSLPVTMYSPSFRGAVTERTEIRVAYDDAYLYVAGRMYDSDPTGVRSNTLYRDQYSGDDVFAIVLDTYNDNETAVWFSTNPDGVRSDRSVSNDAEFGFGRAMNGDWNTYWDVATAQNDHGWFAEMRIPFSSLGFQNIDGNVVMGLITYRFIARKNERHLFPAIPPNWGMAFAKPSQARRVSLEGVYSRKPVYVSPYVLGGLGRTALLDSTVNAYTFDSDMTNELGGDLKYSPTDNLNLDLSVNTDFAQVEVDDQQVNLTRFSLFFPEKRQFFQERAGLFEFNTGGSSRLFHSRRIGLVDGEPNRIYGGARLVGRAGSTDLGVLNMQTAGRDGLPSENFGVLRLRRQVFNPYSTIGTLLTTRVGTDGSYNVALGVDGVLRPFGDEYLTVKWAQTFDDVTNGSAALDAARIIARWERRNDNGFSYAADFIRSGPDYEPDMGFATRNDFTFARNTIGYKWFQGVQSPLRSITVSNEASAYVRNEDRTGESGLIAPSIQFEMKSGAEIHATYRQVYESVLDPFTVSGGLDVLAGDYWFSEGEIRLQAPRGNLFRPNVTLGGGTFYDGWRTSLSVEPSWNPSRHLELGGGYVLNLVRFPDRDESLDAHLLRLKIQAAVDIHLSLNTFLQYNSTTNEAGVNARFRYHIREGNDLWLVYNEGVNTNRDLLAVPRLPFSQNRTLTVKYTHTFIQ